MDQLTRYAIEYGADKWGKHNYTPFYFNLFKNRRDSVKKVLEIGTAEGASLFMWRDFFPNAIIYGLEIDRKRVDLFINEDRIDVHEGDQSNNNDLGELVHCIGSDIDLIVDDGSHKPEDQIFTFLQVFPLLKEVYPETVYVIEDVADPRIFGKIPEVYKPQMIKFSKRYDDQIIVVKKHG